MIQARIRRGRVEPQVPIPKAWEGQIVNIVPLGPDDDIPDLVERLAALHAMGPMEYEPGEQEEIDGALEELNEISKRHFER